MPVFRRRFRSRRARPRSGSRGLSRKRLWVLVMLAFLLLGFQGFIFTEKNLKPPLMNLAEIRLKQMATQAINTAISESIAQGTNFDKLIDWKTDQSGKITGFMLNYAEHMKITSDTINRVQSLLDQMKTIPEHIPLGQAMNSAILASFGPEIPVRLVPAGAVKVDLDTRNQNVGINMAMVEVYMRIMVDVTIIVPFDSKPEIVETELPISYLLVVGDTPMYYMDNKGNPVGNSAPLPPNVTLPDLKKEAPAGSPAGAGAGATSGTKSGSAPATTSGSRAVPGEKTASGSSPH